MLQLNNIGKRYNKSWVFRELNYSFPEGSCVQVNGGNGAGKSTLLRVIGGFENTSEGEVTYNGKKNIPEKNISLTAPYTNLYNELNLEEHFNLIKKFRPCYIGNYNEVLRMIGYDPKKLHNKPIGQYSSGMKQRVKVLFACMVKSDILILDEPCSNLDTKGVHWYNEVVPNYQEGRTILVATNDSPREAPFCTEIIAL